MRIQKKKILVTGGAGFLGSHIVGLLVERNNEVTVLDDFSNGKMTHLEGIKHRSNLHVINGDIRKYSIITIYYKSYYNNNIYINLKCTIINKYNP